MKYRTFGRQSRQVFEIGFGLWVIGGTVGLLRVQTLMDSLEKLPCSQERLDA